MPSRGRPPRVTYEQVELTALEIASSGGKPTVAAVQERLRVKSATVVARHLDRWERSRRASRIARTPFGVGAEDVEALGPADFTQLINHLVGLEVRAHGVPGIPDTTRRINDPDGGVDGRLVWQGGPERTPRLPTRHIVWQLKAGLRLGERALADELLLPDRSGLKPRIREALAAGGAYVLFSAADMTADQKMRRVSAMQAAARPHLDGIDPNIAIMAGDEIAAWASQDLASRSRLIRAAGRDHPALLISFEEWAQLPAFQNPYVWNELTTAIAIEIRNSANVLGSAFRLTGAPGLGKTRLALEALRPLVEGGNSVVYFDARHPGSSLQLLSAIPDWRRLGVGGILVVDDCDQNLHQQIVQAIAGSALSVISIYYRYETSTNPKVGNALRPTTSAVIEEMVRGFEGQIAAANFRRIVDYAEGWPLMAILVYNALRHEQVMIADLTDDQVTERLIGESEDSDAYATLQVLALFDHVGFSERRAHEWAQLRALFLESVPEDRAERYITQFIRKGLIVSIGRYWRVTPPPLALRLTRRWLEDANPEKRTRLFTDLDPDLTESLSRRFGEVTTDRSVALAADLLSPAGAFGTLKKMLGRTRASIVHSLAQVNPAAGAAALTRTLSPLSEKQLFAIGENEGRQDLVWTLEGLAFHRDHFQAAARQLFALARNENAEISNNASGTLVKLFAITGSQTEAPPELRIEILREMLRYDSLASLRLIARALERILSINPATVMLGVESQGGRPALIEWRPRTWEEVFNYIDAAVTIALELSARPHGLELAREVVADGIPLLVRYRCWGDLERAIQQLKGPAWPKAVDRLRWAIRQEQTQNEADAIARASGILHSLMPTEFSEQVKLYVSEAPLQLEQEGNRTIDRSLENVDRFAQVVIAQGRVREAFELVSSGASHRLPHAFGQAIAKRTTTREAVVEDVFAAFAHAKEPRNDLALMGAVGTFAELDPQCRADLLQRIHDDDRLIAALPAAAIWPRADAHAVDLLIRAFREGRLTEPPRANLFMGSAYSAVDKEHVRTLAEVFLARKWHSTAIALLTFGIEDRSGLDDIFQDIILDSEFIEHRMDDIHEWTLLEITKRLVRDHVDFALKVNEKMIRLALASKANFEQRRRVSDLWPVLLGHDAVWRRFVEYYSTLPKRQRWSLLIATKQSLPAVTEERLAIEDRPRAELLAFAEANRDDVPAFLAQYGTTILTEGLTQESVRLTPLMFDLLEHFGDRDDVLTALYATFHSFLSVGPRSGYYARRIGILDEIPTFGNVKIALWKETLQGDLELERERATLRDQEMEEGII